MKLWGTKWMSDKFAKYDENEDGNITNYVSSTIAEGGVLNYIQGVSTGILATCFGVVIASFMKALKDKNDND